MDDIKEENLIGFWAPEVDSRLKLQILENNKFELMGCDHDPIIGDYELNQNKLELNYYPRGANDDGVINREYLIDSSHKCKANGSNPYILDGCDYLFGKISDWTLEFGLEINVGGKSNDVIVSMGPFFIGLTGFKYNIQPVDIHRVAFEKPLNAICANLTNVKIIRSKNVVSIYFNGVLEYTVHELNPYRTDLKGIKFDNFSGTIENIKLTISQPLAIQFDICELSESQNSSRQNQRISNLGSEVEAFNIKLVCVSPKTFLSVDLSKMISIEETFFSLNQLLLENKGIVNDSSKKSNLNASNSLHLDPAKGEWFVDINKKLDFFESGDQTNKSSYWDIFKFNCVFVLFVLLMSFFMCFLKPGGGSGFFAFIIWFCLFCSYYLLNFFGFIFIGLWSYSIFTVLFKNHWVWPLWPLQDSIQSRYSFRSLLLAIFLIYESLGIFNGNYDSIYGKKPVIDKKPVITQPLPSPQLPPSQVFQERLNSAITGATKTEEDRTQVYKKLAEMGVKKSEDLALQVNAPALPLAKQLVRLDAESREWHRKIIAYETAILEAKAVERSLEFEKNGIPEGEMRKLEENLRISIEKSMDPNLQGNTELDFHKNFENALKNSSNKLDPRK